MFSGEFCEIFKNTYIYRPPLVAVSDDWKEKLAFIREIWVVYATEFCWMEFHLNVILRQGNTAEKMSFVSKLFIFLSFFSAMNILLNHRFNYFSWVLSYLQKHSNFNFVSLIRCENCQIFMKYFQFSFVVFLIFMIIAGYCKTDCRYQKAIINHFLQSFSSR